MNENWVEGYDEWEIELARRIACTVLAFQMHISYRHCWNLYIQDTPIGIYWLEIAKQIRK